MIPVEQARKTVREVHSRVAAACDKTHPRRHVKGDERGGQVAGDRVAGVVDGEVHPAGLARFFVQ